MDDDKATVFIIDDDPKVRDALSVIISQENILVSTFSNGPEFLAANANTNSGCAIIDLKMPCMSGIELQQAMHDLDILLPIIFLTGYGDIPTSVKAIKNGAIDFLTKPVKADELIKTVKLAILQSTEIASKNHTKSNYHSLVDRLTKRECDVMQLAVRGLQNKLIAQKLGISHRTVEIHKSKIMSKTGAINLLNLAQIAREAGLEPPPSSIELESSNNTISAST